MLNTYSNLSRLASSLHLVFLTLALASCGGGSTSPEAVRYAVGGKVSGLMGNLTLSLNGTLESLSLSDNQAFNFNSKLPNGSIYQVDVSKNPATPSQVCGVDHGSGVLEGSDVTNIEVVCATNAYGIGGSVSGLSGGTLKLQLNNGETLQVDANGAFEFKSKLPDLMTYRIRVSQLPQAPLQVCDIENDSGKMTGRDVANVVVRCRNVDVPAAVTQTRFWVTGTIEGLKGDRLGLVLNSKEILDIPGSTDALPKLFAFVTTIESGKSYRIDVSHAPTNPNQNCSIDPQSQNSVNADVRVRVQCFDALDNGTAAGGGGGSNNNGSNSNTNTFTNTESNVGSGIHSVGGTAYGVPVTGLTLQLNGINDLTLTADGVFAFSRLLQNNEGYSVSIVGYGGANVSDCEIQNHEGTMANGDFMNVRIICDAATAPVLVSGAMQGRALSLIPEVTTVRDLINGGSLPVTFGKPVGVTTTGDGNFYVTDVAEHTVRVLTPANAKKYLIAGKPGILGFGDGAGINAAFNAPEGVTTDGAFLYVSDTRNHVIRKIEIETRVVSTIAGTITSGGGVSGYANGDALSARFNEPRGIAYYSNALYIADSKNHVIRKIDLATMQVETIAGVANTFGLRDSSANVAALFNQPSGVVAVSANALFVADTGNNRIRKIDLGTKNVTTLSANQPAVDIVVNAPYGITSDGVSLYVTEYSSHTIKKIAMATGANSVFVGVENNAASVIIDGGPGVAKFNEPSGLTSDGANLYIVDRNLGIIRRVK